MNVDIRPIDYSQDVVLVNHSLGFGLPTLHIFAADLHDVAQGLTAADCQWLAAGLAANPVVETLSLNWDETVEAEGVEAVAQCLINTTVTTLVLDRVGLRAEGCSTLGASLPLTHLTRLYVDENCDIGDAGVEALTGRLAECELTVLGLRAVGLGAAGCTVLAQRLPGWCVEELRLGENRLGDAGVGAVAARLAGSGLKSLDLSDVGTGDAGCAALMQGILGSQVEDMNLWNNVRIGAAGRAAVRAVSSVHNLQEVLGPGFPGGGWGQFPLIRIRDLVVFADVLTLSGMRWCHVAHAVALYMQDYVYDDE
jgi:hypothetical protein